MNSQDHYSAFSIARFKLLLRRFLVLNQKNWVIGFLGAAGLLFSFWLIPVLMISAPIELFGFKMIEGTAMFIYAVGGLALTSRIYFELHSPNTAFQFLTLPASTLEKFSAAWFISTIGYTAAAVAVLFLLSLLIEVISGFSTGIWENFKLFNPFENKNLQRFAAYFFYHSIFLLGAVYFRKNNFFKTLLVIITFFIVLFFTITIGGLILAFMMVAEDFSINYQLLETVTLWHSLLLYLLGTLCTLIFLLFGYLQLKNKQVV